MLGLIMVLSHTLEYVIQSRTQDTYAVGTVLATSYVTEYYLAGVLAARD